MVDSFKALQKKCLNYFKTYLLRIESWSSGGRVINYNYV